MRDLLSDLLNYVFGERVISGGMSRQKYVNILLKYTHRPIFIHFINSYLIVLKPANEIRFFIILKYKAVTVILSVDNKYSVRDLHSDLNNYV